VDAIDHWLSDSRWIVHVLNLEAVEEPEDAMGGVEVVVDYINQQILAHITYDMWEHKSVLRGTYQC